MVPSCVRLDEKQLALLDNWYNTLPVPEDFEDCCCTSFVKFEITRSGIGDIIIAKAFGKSIHLEYDDDGVLVATYKR